MSYAEKLKDPRWQKMRLQILERDGFMCQSCESKTKTLHVHHARYIKNYSPWDYEPDELLTLCDECHTEREKLISGWLLIPSTMTNRQMEIATKSLFFLLNQDAGELHNNERGVQFLLAAALLAKTTTNTPAPTASAITSLTELTAPR